MNAQVFQNSACNWRCWYCYVPSNLLAANENHADWLSATQLVDLYLAEKHPPVVIDCSGGQPDLIPEWVPWMMTELRRRGLADSVYLWSGDNLSNDFFWRYLSSTQRSEMTRYRNYGRVCCFKGFNADSFAFNTKTDQALLGRQFELFPNFSHLISISMPTPRSQFQRATGSSSTWQNSLIAYKKFTGTCHYG